MVTLASFNVLVNRLNSFCFINYQMGGPDQWYPQNVTAIIIYWQQPINLRLLLLFAWYNVVLCVCGFDSIIDWQYYAVLVS